MSVLGSQVFGQALVDSCGCQTEYFSIKATFLMSELSGGLNTGILSGSQLIHLIVSSDLPCSVQKLAYVCLLKEKLVNFR